QKLPPIRETLEHLLVLYRQGVKDDPALPWEIQTAERVREASAKDLEAYLRAGVPPQAVQWTVRPPETANGRFPIEVSAGIQAISIDAVIGNQFAPGPAEMVATGGPIRLVKVSVPSAHPLGPFFELAGHDVGWIWVYIVVYLPL